MDTQLLKEDSATSQPLAKIFGHYATTQVILLKKSLRMHY